MYVYTLRMFFDEIKRIYGFKLNGYDVRLLPIDGN